MGRFVAILQRLAGVGGELAEHSAPAADGVGQVVLVGNPNVGKSVLFNCLTGRYVTVSNYPGTTVEVSRGASGLFAQPREVVDTPGMYSLLPITDEERVARDILMTQTPHAVIHVVDAKSIHRMLPLTLQLIDAQLPVVLVLNMSDEAQAAGVKIDYARLEQVLGVPVVPTVATRGKGIDELIRRVNDIQPHTLGRMVDYGPVLGPAIDAIASAIPDGAGIGPISRAILLLQGDHQQRQLLGRQLPPQKFSQVSDIAVATLGRLSHTAHYSTSLSVKAASDALLAKAVQLPSGRSKPLLGTLNDLLMNPLTGLPILLLVLYFGLYKFVGEFGAGVMVGYIEGLFERFVNPSVNAFAAWLLPWPAARELIGGDFGVVTLGLRYALAIVLPIVGTFFLAFSILEDSGYLPRLAMMVDRVFKKIGLNGRAVIPMVLGFGCDTMATMVTRTLETRRERVIATFLLALAIPCSAQIGVILGLLAGHPMAMAVWAGVIVTVFMGAGLLAARFLPGERPSFYMELPPLRLPRLGNVLVKTYSRMVWYFREIIPLFVIASVLIWVGRMTGAFQWLTAALVPLVNAIGLPDEASVAFLYGFFRRDYGVAGLYDLHRQGMLAGNQLVVAAVTLTLFLPCIAQFLVMKKERGWRMTLAVSAFICVFAFVMGYAVHIVLSLLKVQL